LLHVSEIAWGRVEHPSDILSEGQEIEVKVLGADREEGKVSLGLKQLKPNPWSTAEEKYPAGTIVSGKVLRLAPFGAFVEVEPGIEGLVHISQLSDQHVEKTEDAVTVGQEVQIKVLSVDEKSQRMSLSIKQTKPGGEKPRERKEPARSAAPVSAPPAKEEEGITLGDLFGDLFAQNQQEEPKEEE
jgi:4-hydroxy-3-methylbut-2-enyl diphosphate reductase